VLSFNRPVGGRRRLLVVRADLAACQTVAHRQDATVNDVILAAMAGGARRLLAGRGELAPGLVLKISVAASIRRPGETGGNRTGIRIVPLRLDEADAVESLNQISTETMAQRDLPPYQPGGPLSQRWMVRVMFHQRLVNLLLSNLRGPTQSLTFCGARVRKLFQIGVLQGNMPLVVGVLSYAGQLNIDIVADTDLVPDVAAFATGFSQTLDQLGVTRRGCRPG
jgi:hypothetical protein